MGCPWADAEVPAASVLKKDDLRKEGHGRRLSLGPDPLSGPPKMSSKAQRMRVAQGPDLGSKPSLCHLLAVGPWATHFTSLSLFPHL